MNRFLLCTQARNACVFRDEKLSDKFDVCAYQCKSLLIMKLTYLHTFELHWWIQLVNILERLEIAYGLDGFGYLSYSETSMPSQRLSNTVQWTRSQLKKGRIWYTVVNGSGFMNRCSLFMVHASGLWIVYKENSSPEKVHEQHRTCSLNTLRLWWHFLLSTWKFPVSFS